MNGRDRIDERRERLLEEWLAGDLEPGSDAERALLAQEPGLLDELERHRALRAAVRELPAELEPENDLWPGVAARIAPAARRPRRVLPRRILPWHGGPWRSAVAFPAAALAAALAVAVGTVLLRQERTPGEPHTPAAATASRPVREAAPEAAPGTTPETAAAASSAERQAAAPPAARLPAPAAAPRSTSTPAVLAAAAPQSPPAPFAADLDTTGTAVPALAAYAETDRQLSALGAELRRTIEAQQERLPPETRRIVFDNLATIERALAEIETALVGAPGDAELARTYIEYRQREIAVLRRANAMAARL